MNNPTLQPHTRRILPVLVLTLLISPTTGAQQSATGALQATVTTTAGTPIPKANIALRHDPSGDVRRGATDDKGSCLLTGLRPGGPYNLRVSHVGFRAQVSTGIFLGRGDTAFVRVHLEQTEIRKEEVVVTGERADTSKKHSPGISLAVERAQLELLPRPSGKLEDVYRLSPYMAGASAIGFNTTANAISLDGIDITDQYGLQNRESLPGSIQGNPFSLETVQDIRVDLNPFDVRRSGFTGAAISAVSRPGPRVLSGSAFAEGAGGWWLGSNPDDQRNDLRGYSDWRAGFSIGGPIVRSRATFTLTGEKSAIRLPVDRRFDAPKTQGSTFSFPAAAVEMLQNTLQSAYGYSAEGIDKLRLFRQTTTLFGRVDLPFSRGQRLTLRYNYLESGSDRPPYGPVVYAQGALARNTTRTQTGILSLSSIFNSTLTNEFLVGFTTRRFTSTPRGRPFPFVDVTVIDRRNWWNHIIVGSEIGGEGESLAQDHLEVHNNTSLLLGNHLMTLGFQGDIHWFTDRLQSYGWGRYTFSSVQALFLRRTTEYEYRYSVDPASARGVTWGAWQAAALLQDEWRILPFLSVSMGVRADLPGFPDPPRENPAIREVFAPLGFDVSTSTVPRSRVLVSPRIGFTADLQGHHPVRARGGVGLFTGRIPYAWIGNLYTHTGLTNRHIKISANAPAFVADPLTQPVPGVDPTLTETTEIVVIDREFTLPREVRWNFGMDLSLPGSLLLSFEGVYSRTLNGVVFRNINLKPAGTLNPFRGGDARTLFGNSSGQGQWVYSRHDPRCTDVILMSNGEGGEASFVTVQLQRRPVHDGSFASIAYSFGSTKDLNSGTWDNAYDQWRYNPAEQPNVSGLNFSAFDRTHRLVAAFSYNHEWSAGFITSFGMVYTAISGMPFSYVYDGDVNGDGESLNDLFFVPSNSTQIFLVNSDGELTVPEDPAYFQLFDFIAHDPYLSSRRGKVCERNGARGPWSHQLDLRLAQTLALGEDGGRCEIELQLLNLPNLLNPAWGHVYYVPYQVAPVLQFFKLDVLNRPWYRWAPRTSPLIADPLLSRWRVRVGMRFSV